MERTYKHDLVPEGKVCPECVWDLAACVSGNSPSIQRKRENLMGILLEACEALLPPELKGQVRLEAQNGNWYALRFVTRWKAEQQKAARKAECERRRGYVRQ